LVVNGFSGTMGDTIALFLHSVFSSFDIFYGLLATAYVVVQHRRLRGDPSV
jgi:hypothetical protein